MPVSAPYRSDFLIPPGGCRRFHGWPGSLGLPCRSVPCTTRWPNCSAVLILWHAAQRQRMLLSSSAPPHASGMMWSGTVDGVSTEGCLARQSRHSGSSAKRRRRCSTPRRPRRRPGSGSRLRTRCRLASGIIASHLFGLFLYENAGHLRSRRPADSQPNHMRSMRRSRLK